MYGALISAGAGILGSALRGSGPTWKADQQNRGLQEQQLARYRRMQEGKGPSLAGQMLQAQAQKGMAQQQAMAAGARGGALQQSLARRQAGQVGAQMAGQAGQAAATARTREQLAAMGQVDRSLSAAEARKLRDYQISRGEFDSQSDHLGNIFGAVGDMGSIPGLLGGGGGNGKKK